jgi:hypothetical protein
MVNTKLLSIERVPKNQTRNYIHSSSSSKVYIRDRRVIPPSKYTIVQQEKDNKLLRPNDGEEKEMTGVFFLSLFLSHSDCLFPSNIPVNPLCELMAPYIGAAALILFCGLDGSYIYKPSAAIDTTTFSLSPASSALRSAVSIYITLCQHERIPN